jgi:hypothetical protein
MAKANFVKKAQKDIFVNGKRVKYVSLKGKRKGQTLSKIDRTVSRDDTEVENWQKEITDEEINDKRQELES